MKILEVCVDSLESAINAEKGGAARIELCANIIIGGTTPSLFLFQEVRENCSLPIHTLIRPRFGDFCYSESEVRIMTKEIIQFKKAGANGVVIGALTPEGFLDMNVMETLCKAATGMSITLHRAFDMCKDPFDTLNKAVELKIDTILTSGQQNNCIDGADLIKKLVAVKKIDIMAGGGITPDNIKEIITKTGATGYHLTGKKKIDSKMIFRNKNVNMGFPSISEYENLVTCADIIAGVKVQI